MLQPLPSNPYNTGQQAVLHVAYGRCTTLQNRHSQVVPCSHLSVLICARILGYMILEAPTDEGRTELATEIVRCVGDEDLQKLAEIYKNHLLRVCKPLFRCLSHPLTKDASQFSETRGVPQRLLATLLRPLLMHKQLVLVHC
jgi:hypothetical protein